MIKEGCSALLTFWAASFPAGDCPVHCKMFRSIPSFYLIDTRNKKLFSDVTKCPQQQKLPPVENGAAPTHSWSCWKQVY